MGQVWVPAMREALISVYIRLLGEGPMTEALARLKTWSVLGVHRATVSLLGALITTYYTKHLNRISGTSWCHKVTGLPSDVHIRILTASRRGILAVQILM